MPGASGAETASVGRDGLGDELARIERLLTAAAAGDHADGAATGCSHRGLRRLADCFALAPLERDLIAIALAVELSPHPGPLLDRLSGRSDGRPTVAALATVLAGADRRSPDPVTAALAPGGHLIRAGLVELIGDGRFPTRVVRLPDRIWPRIVDLPAPLPFPVFPQGTASLATTIVAPSTRAQAERAVARARLELGRALLVVSGSADRAPDLLATALAGELGLAGLIVTAAAVADPAAQCDIRREATWLQAAVLVQGVPPATALTRLSVDVPVPIVVIADAPPALDACSAPDRWRLDVEVAELPLAERVAGWRRHLDGVEVADGDQLVQHARQHRFGIARIAAVASAARDQARARRAPVDRDDLRRATSRAAGPTYGLAHRLDAIHHLGDLVVPATTRRELDLACAWARHAGTALSGPAAGRPLHDRDGLVCLFYGPPGTGKTLAARAIAGELGVDLLRIDLSQVINKYIGETEKNLDRVFDEAEETGALLFFDEADALFGKRTEVKDAHDRYANVETAFLLQRLEMHRGVCVLASNLRQNLDEAFTRRIQIVAEFPLPGPADRALIWERHLIADRLDPEVDLVEVGRRFAISGGDICNAAATALILAAADQAEVAMRHLAVGVWREIKKSGRLVRADDFGPWRPLITGLERPT